MAKVRSRRQKLAVSFPTRSSSRTMATFRRGIFSECALLYTAGLRTLFAHRWRFQISLSSTRLYILSYRLPQPSSYSQRIANAMDIFVATRRLAIGSGPHERCCLELFLVALSGFKSVFCCLRTLLPATTSIGQQLTTKQVIFPAQCTFPTAAASPCSRSSCRTSTAP